MYLFSFFRLTNMKLIFLLIAGIGLAAAQVPGFGGCPEFDSQPDFDMNKVSLRILSFIVVIVFEKKVCYSSE